MKYIFTLTTGRSGTAYLAELLKNIPDSICYHERNGPKAWGYITPDISHMMAYNYLGQNDHTRAFWEKKAKHIHSLDCEVYAETSHVLAKAGLIENLDLFPEATILCLHRDTTAVFSSMIRRGDYSQGSKGSMWLWLLDPDYARNLTQPILYTQEGLVAWYLREMEARETCLKTPNFINCQMESIITREGATELLKQFNATLKHLPGKINH